MKKKRVLYGVRTTSKIFDTVNSKTLAKTSTFNTGND